MTEKPLISLRTELVLLSAMLNSKSVLSRALPHLNTEMFGSSIGRRIFERMVDLLGKGKDLPSARMLSGDPGLDRKAAAALSHFAKRQDTRLKSFSKGDVDSALDTLEYYREVRILYETSKKIYSEISGPKRADIDTLRADIQQDLSLLSSKSQGGGTVVIGEGGNLADQYIEAQLKAQLGEIIPTGINVVDRRIKGWRKSNIVLLTAPRGQGKSMLAKTLSVNHFKDKRNVAVINLEMSEWEYLVRLFAQETPFRHEQLRKGTRNPKNIRKVVAKKNALDRFGAKHNCRWTLRTITNPLYGAQSLHSEMKYQGFEVILIDYINLLSQRGKDLWAGIYDAAQYLKMMAKDLNCLVYILAQLNEEDRAKYAKALEEVADVWLWWRKVEGDPVVTVKHGKARDYDPFTFQLQFDGSKSMFRDVEDTLVDADEEEEEKPKRLPKGDMNKRVREAKKHQRTTKKSDSVKTQHKKSNSVKNWKRPRTRGQRKLKSSLEFEDL